jgi:uncharacterized BrkB/YihY/UPF0761 family membrane protein
MRFFSALIAGLFPLMIGVALFVYIGNQERRFEANMRSIRAGKVSPETLTVISKYINPGRRGSGFPHVVFRSDRTPKANCRTTLSFYNSVNPGSKVTGYYFPDGYFIPESSGHDAGVAKWIFLCSGVLTGGVFAVLIFVLGRSMPARMGALLPGANMQTVLAAIRDRANRE